MALSYTEDLLYDVRAYVIANLDTYLTAIKTEKGDSRTIPLGIGDTNSVLVGATDLASYDNYPVIIFHPVQTNWEPIASGLEQMEITTAIWVVCGGYEETRLARMVYRYADAFRNLFRENYTLGNKVSDTRMESVEYYPSLLGEPQLKGGKIIVRIVKDISD